MATKTRTAKRRPAAPKARRPGGRSARVRDAVLKATLEELAERGYTALSLESVAKRAGVHKTTLYRRWGKRESLVLDAMLERVGEGVPVPDTGSLRQDLLELARGAAVTASSPEGEAVTRAVAGESPYDAGLAEAARSFWAERLALDAVIVERAIARGEAAKGTDAVEVIESVVAPIYFRLLATGESLKPAFIEGVVGRVVDGLAPESGAAG